MPFEKGVSGNPKGRRRGTKNKKLLVTFADTTELLKSLGPSSIRKLRSLIRSKDERVALKASVSVVAAILKLREIEEKKKKAADGAAPEAPIEKKKAVLSLTSIS